MTICMNYNIMPLYYLKLYRIFYADAVGKDEFSMQKMKWRE